MGNVTLTKSSNLNIEKVEPVAVHLKEVNHIDPLSIDALHVNEVKNIDPLEIARLNVTRLPMVNVSLQKVPGVDINVKSLPPLSVGVHQNFCLPSSYTLRARILGIEVARFHLNGQTHIIPQDRARREHSRADNRSFPTTAAVGNPAIPSHCDTGASHSSHVGAQMAPNRYSQAATPMATPQASVRSTPPTGSMTGPSVGLSFGAPRNGFSIPEPSMASPMATNRVASGG